MKVAAIKCPNCKDIIFSRAHYDYHSCTCGETSIDGGFDYCRIAAKDVSKIKAFQLEVNATKKELYNDWNLRKNKYGVIHEVDSQEK